jgi:hypothetical protein
VKEKVEYIVLNSGDTLYGDVRSKLEIGINKKYHNKVGYKAPGKESKHYTANDLKAYKRKDFHCVSAQIPSRDEKVFLYHVIEGRMNYYVSGERTSTSPVYSGTTMGYMGGASGPKPSLFIKKDKDFIEVKKKNFSDVVKENFFDCNYFSDGTVGKKLKLKGKKYSHNNIESLVELYNERCSK